MMLAVFLLFLLTVDGASCDDNCTYLQLFNHLNLTSKNDVYSMSRPVKDHRLTTIIDLEMLIYAILDVRETDQTFIPYVWLYMSWKNELINWNPDDFCGLQRILVPAEIMWKPDVIIEEMTEKDKAPPNPYLIVDSEGYVDYRKSQVVVSTCRMRVYKFPFDTQRCTISFKSAVHSDKEIRLQVFFNATEATELSRFVMHSQYEWLFVSQAATEQTVYAFGFNQSMIVYTITMRRRSVLYIINFLLPVLFFLCLDLSSFLISDRGGEKLSFKVTVLLAVTVLQLILNEILPSSSDRAPLVAVYCIGTFGLMMLSLIETIFVMYLMEKDKDADSDPSPGDSKVNHRCFGGVRKLISRASISDISLDETAPELQSGSQLTEDSHTLEKLSDELGKMEKMLTLLLNSRNGDAKPGYWIKMTKTINRVFFIFYLTMICLFLFYVFSEWSSVEPV